MDHYGIEDKFMKSMQGVRFTDYTKDMDPENE